MGIAMSNKSPFNINYHDGLSIMNKNNNIITIYPTRIEKIKKIFNESESFLFNFFETILIDSKKSKIFGFVGDEIVNFNLDDTKILVNYYNIIKSEVYIDLNLPIRELISHILGQIFYPFIIKKSHKRVKKNHTTEYIILNPTNETNEEVCFYNYTNFLYLEFNGMNLSKFSEKNCKDLGIKKGDELSLKISKKLYQEINTFPKQREILIAYDSYTLSISYISKNINNYGKFKDVFNIFNTNSFRNTNYIRDNEMINRINFTSLGNITGAGGGIFDGYIFVDPSNSSIKQIQLSKMAPKWRVISQGLNLFGLCENKKCEAYKKEVVYRTLVDQKSLPEEGLIFDMFKNVTKIKCPICKKIFTADTCGFYKCEYQFKGKKIEEGDEIDYDSKTRETKGNNIEYYEPNKKKRNKVG